MRRDQFMTVTESGQIDTVTTGTGSPATTTDLVTKTAAVERWTIQQVGNEYEVYDRRKVRSVGGEWVMGMPVFTSPSLDAATMWALLQGKE